MLPDLKDIVIPDRATPYQITEQKRLLIEAIGYVCDYLTEWEDDRPDSYNSSDRVAEMNDFLKAVEDTCDKELADAIKPTTDSKKYDDNSLNIGEWTTEKLKAEAIGYHETIYKVECYGTRDLRSYDGIMTELRKRGIEPKTELTF